MADKIEWGGTPGPWEATYSEDDEEHVILMDEAIDTPWSHPSEQRIVYDHLCDYDPRPGSQFQLAATNARAIAEVPAMVAALRTCSAQFRFYEQAHLAKGTQDGDEKAYRNKQFADMIDTILARIDGK